MQTFAFQFRLVLYILCNYGFQKTLPLQVYNIHEDRELQTRNVTEWVPQIKYSDTGRCYDTFKIYNHHDWLSYIIIMTVVIMIDWLTHQRQPQTITPRNMKFGRYRYIVLQRRQPSMQILCLREGIPNIGGYLDLKNHCCFSCKNGYLESSLKINIFYPLP